MSSHPASSSAGASDRRESAAANKLRIALQVREAMREYRKGKPIAFQPRRHP